MNVYGNYGKSVEFSGCNNNYGKVMVAIEVRGYNGTSLDDKANHWVLNRSMVAIKIS
jgi:hypothetical protein